MKLVFLILALFIMIVLFDGCRTDDPLSGKWVAATNYISQSADDPEFAAWAYSLMGTYFQMSDGRGILVIGDSTQKLTYVQSTASNADWVISLINENRVTEKLTIKQLTTTEFTLIGAVFKKQ